MISLHVAARTMASPLRSGVVTLGVPQVEGYDDAQLALVVPRLARLSYDKDQYDGLSHSVLHSGGSRSVAGELQHGESE
ncbi:hypothetical protein Q4I30_003266 [Leishmania utingensis]|uniref:Uncharacterized protein n=2 Tax=Viannia TaxID=37616 RepID=A0AAW3BYX1_9TRYP